MDEDRNVQRHFDARSTQFQSKEPGQIIKSLRKFGIEVEMFHPTNKALGDLSKLVSKVFGIEHDGSIDAGGGHGVEVVSPILRGAAGENAIVEVFKTINSLGFLTNKSCGVHVHLDGIGFAKTEKVFISPIRDLADLRLLSTLSQKNGDYAFIISNEVMARMGQRMNPDDIAQLITDEYMASGGRQFFLSKELGQSIPEINRGSCVLEIGTTKSFIDIYKFVEPGEDDIDITKPVVVEELKPNTDDFLIIVKGNNNLQNILTLLYLHTVYSDVFMAMLPKSRRQDNLYCQSLSLGFSAGEIERIRSYTELETAWYKTRNMRETSSRKGNKYDDSRYFTVNLHSLFAKYGTIEIRSHSATLDHNKVLYWAAFHQEILDRIVAGAITIQSLRQGASLSDPDDKTAFLMDVLGLRTPLRKYMQTRIDYFKTNETK